MNKTQKRPLGRFDDKRELGFKTGGERDGELEGAELLDWLHADVVERDFEPELLEPAFDVLFGDWCFWHILFCLYRDDDLEAVDFCGELALLPLFFTLFWTIVQRLVYGNRLSGGTCGQMLREEEGSGVTFGDVDNGTFGAKGTDVGEEGDEHKRNAFLIILTMSR